MYMKDQVAVIFERGAHDRIPIFFFFFFVILAVSGIQDITESMLIKMNVIIWHFVVQQAKVI